MQGIKEILYSSFFWRCLRKKSFTPEIYKGSFVMVYLIKPFYLWIKSHFPFSKALPQIGLGLAIFISSFYNPVVFDTHLARFRIGLMFLPVLLIAGVIRSEIKAPRKTVFDLPVFLLLIAGILSLRTVGDTPALFLGLKELMSLFLFVMSIYLVIYIFTKKEIKKLFYVLGLAGIGAAFFFILTTVFLKNGELYLRNTFGNPNHFGHFLVLLYPIALAISLDNPGRSRHLWRLGVVLIMGGIFFTYSLGAWISFFLSLPILAISLKKRWPLVFLAVLTITFTLFPFMRHKFLEQISIGYGSTIMARIEVWKAALASIYERPILGVGLGQFHASAKPYYAREMYNAFSVFFHLASTTGILGLILFLWFLIRAFKLNISLLRTEKLYGGALLTSLTAGVVCFLWDTHLLATITNWLLGMLLGSSLVMETFFTGKD